MTVGADGITVVEQFDDLAVHHGYLVTFPNIMDIEI